jgi:hypothetical protein
LSSVCPLLHFDATVASWPLAHCLITPRLPSTSRSLVIKRLA